MAYQPIENYGIIGNLRTSALIGVNGSVDWYPFPRVEALTRDSADNPQRLQDARLLFEQMLGYANHLGLYAEQTGDQGQALGNFPQALTHLAMISAAFNLDPIWKAFMGR